jgi:beta-galactosidase
MGTRATRLGVAYYPEQWPRERWPVDAALMAEAGLLVVRMGEFSWSRLEPAPGELDFEWLDEAIGLMSAHGLEVILGTPTAAPPAWLIEQCPEILPLRADGRRQSFGHRRHYCPNNPHFHEATRRIVAALAGRYGEDDRVVAWQIDNELAGRCFCDVCRASFQEWLRDRYGSLDALNESWGTAFWSQTYSAWSQIPLPEGAPVPLPDGFLRASPNPSLALDFRRFVSDSYLRYLRLQLDELRAHAGRGQPITTNLMGFRFAELDYHALVEPLDAIAWDNYPLLDREARWSSPALAADAMRGLKDAPVWVLEQQVGPLGWEVVRSPRRGQMRLHSYQAIGHGAELLVYFRWRTARHGTEQHWHGVLDSDGRPGRRFQELVELARELERLGEVLVESTPVADLAILHDYDSRFALQVQPTNPVLAFEDTLQSHYEALRRLGLGVDVLGPGRELSRYPAVVAPSLTVVDPALAESLRAYVEGGGMLVLGARTGVRDRHNVAPDRPVPAWLDELAGVERTDVASLLDRRELRFVGVDGVPDGAFRGWAEELQLKGARALAVYAEGDFAEMTAVASHSVGAGRVVYLGGAATDETLLDLYRVLAADAGLSRLELPDGVEALRLSRNGSGELLLLLNHADEERVVEPGGTCRDLVTESAAVVQVRLAPFGVALLESVPSAVESA